MENVILKIHGKMLIWQTKKFTQRYYSGAWGNIYYFSKVLNIIEQICHQSQTAKPATLKTQRKDAIW
jgi:hypothetical protein